MTKTTLKDCRKQGREFLNNYGWKYRYLSIAFNKHDGFYFTPDIALGKNIEEVFILYADGRLEKKCGSPHSIKFHEELERRRQKRNKNKI